MPKLIDYPRTNYAGAWEVAEVVDDTGGKCAIETAARKLNRKVSGSFKAIIGSGVKFGLLTSKRELLTTTTLFKRIKHAYDKEEEIVFHREAFLTPPLFTQLCRKFRSRELPVQMLDVMLIREFGVEEINAQGVAKAFVDGSRMVGLLNENNIIADIDALASKQRPRRELGSQLPVTTSFVPQPEADSTQPTGSEGPFVTSENVAIASSESSTLPEKVAAPSRPDATAPTRNDADAVSTLFGLPGYETQPTPPFNAVKPRVQTTPTPEVADQTWADEPPIALKNKINHPEPLPIQATTPAYQLQVSGPGINSTLEINDEDDLAIAQALIEKIRRQLRNQR